MTNFDTFTELMTRQEELHADLLPWVTTKPITMVNHPLVQETFLIEGRCALINERYRQTKLMVEKARMDGDMGAYVFLHTRPYRLDAFTKWAGPVTPAKYWQMLSAIWIDSENIWQNKAVWRGLWKSLQPERENAMEPDELEALAKLPDDVRVYRGICGPPCDKAGLSWTTDLQKAEYFSRRFQRSGKTSRVIYGRVARKDIMAYLLSRGEFEVISTKVKVEGNPK